jgi:ABC-type phosphate/phosphonate transport system substrate-binding protein
MKNSWKTIALLNIAVLLSISSLTSIAASNEIRLAILMPAPAKIIHKNWQPLADYLTKAMGQEVTIVTPRGLEQAKASIGKVDFVYSNSYLYSLLAAEAKVTAVAQMKNTGDSIYSQGRFLVRNDSAITTIKDLKGKKVALISRYGAGSYLAPRASFAKEGLDIEKDLHVEYTKNLKKAAYMVMLGEADVAVMCGVNYEILSKKIDTGELRVFDMTDKFPEAVMFTPKDPNSTLVKRFQKALLADNDNREKALTLLHGMKIGTFIDYDPIVENRIKELSSQAGLTAL